MFPLFNNQLVNTQCLQNTRQLSVHEMHRAAKTTIGFTFLSYLFTTNLRLKRVEWSFHQRTEHGTEWTRDRGRRTRPSWADGRISRRPRATGERDQGIRTDEQCTGIDRTTQDRPSRGRLMLNYHRPLIFSVAEVISFYVDENLQRVKSQN